jgi:peroxiredoxin
VLAPLVHVTLHTGETVELASFYKEKPLALVFLRHFGCIFCREQITQLRNYPDENVVFVAMGKVQETVEFKAKMEAPQVFISDPNKSLYDLFGLRRGSFTQMFNTQTFKRGFAATKAGNRVGAPVGDPYMLAGTFIIQPDGVMSFSHYSRDASDNLAGETIIELLGGS